MKYINIKKNKADVLNTHGDNSKIKKELNFKKFRNFNDELIKVIKWYKDIEKKNLF